MLDNYRIAEAKIISDIDKVYAKVLSGVSPGQYYNEMVKFNRLEKLLVKVQKTYNEYAREANVDTLNISRSSMKDIYYRKEYALSAFTLGGYRPLLLNPKLIELTVLGTEEAWKAIPESLIKRYGSMTAFQPQYGTITEIFSKNRIDDLKKIQQQITQGFILGSSNREAVLAIETIFDTTRANAERIVQTEFTRVANAGAYAANVDAENQGFDIKKMWQFTPTKRPHSPAHSNLDGVTKKPKEYFHLGGYKALYPGNFNGGSHNYNCHCSLIDILNDIPPKLRKIRNPVTGKNEVFRWDDYLKWRKENKF